jgi:hypothetical protein
MPTTREMWSEQDGWHPGDRRGLYGAVAGSVSATRVLYPGSFVDIAPSFVWPEVTYVDTDRRAARFFGDRDGVAEIIAVEEGAPPDPEFTFVHDDYMSSLPLADGAFDLLVSLYAGPVSRHCTRYLRVGGVLLVNPSHGDVALASLDDRYVLIAVVRSRSGSYSVSTGDLDSYLVPKRDEPVTVESIERSGRGVAYTRSPFAYLFQRVA